MKYRITLLNICNDATSYFIAIVYVFGIDYDTCTHGEIVNEIVADGPVDSITHELAKLSVTNVLNFSYNHTWI